jgi:hypothetical protein
LVYTRAKGSKGTQSKGKQMIINQSIPAFDIIGLHPAVIAGVASRESNFGFSLTQDGWGDHHHAYGMMQVSSM